MTFHGTVYIWVGEPIPAVPWQGNGFSWSELVAEMAEEDVERQQEQTEEAA